MKNEKPEDGWDIPLRGTLITKEMSSKERKKELIRMENEYQESLK